ncbi:MAG TPA: dihydrofolate reductase family protein [Devosiaceae bacterium]|jgi:dihydrofolate reductase|nr:dihydrofolate reductase family protein [Devosiaceae bacterium]
MAQKLVVTQYVSLDGVIEDPVGMENSGLGNWVGPFSRGPEGDRFKHEELLAAGAMIYGRRTYEGFAAVWPTVDDKEGYARRMNALPKYVASRTLGQADWENSTLIAGDLVEAVRGIKAGASGDVLIFGSGSIVQQLMPAGLIDEFRLMVYPTVLGRGIRLFPAGVDARLQLVESRQFGDGIVLLRYRAS